MDCVAVSEEGGPGEEGWFRRRWTGEVGVIRRGKITSARVSERSGLESLRFLLEDVVMVSCPAMAALSLSKRRVLFARLRSQSVMGKSDAERIRRASIVFEILRPSLVINLHRRTE